MGLQSAMASPRQGVLLLAGYGIRVAVERGHLCVEDGVGANRRTARFPRATRDLRRLVVLGHSGTVSLDALRWLSDIGAGFVHIDSDGKVIAAAGPTGLRDAKLRRAQALAVENGRGLAIGKELVRQKLAGQRALLARLPGGVEAKPVVEESIGRIDAADTVERLRLAEAGAAAAYWGAWARVSVQFARRDTSHVPDHWKTFGRRVSLVTGNPRKATSPANAVLNYLYAIVEAEARIAALAVGCDPGLGIMHADQSSRDSLACDLMEPVRPMVDGWVLDLLEARVFRRSDFFETREGVCRVMPPLTRLLAETAPHWASAVAPIAEQVAAELLTEKAPKKRPRRKRSMHTPLTQANRSAGREGQRIRKPNEVGPIKPGLPRTCVVCGAEVARGARRYCSSCRPIHNPTARARANEVLRAERAAGRDPAHGGEAARKRGASNAAVLRENAVWSRGKRRVFEPETFAREIRPGLAEVSLAEMMRATGLSRQYCAMIRRGVQVPHPRHWEALLTLVRPGANISRNSRHN